MEITTNAIAEYKPIEAVIADLTLRHKGVVFDVKNPEQLAIAKGAAREIAQYRIALEKARVDLKADVLARGRLIDGEAKRIQAQLSALEDPIIDQIKAEERRMEAERQAVIEAEERRLAVAEQLRKEAEEKHLAEERAKNEAETRRLAEERAKFEAERRAEREKVEAERRRLQEEARAEQFRKDEEARAARLEEQRKREAEESARANAEREKRRQEVEQLDSRRMLETFCERFGHLHPELAKTIRAYLGKALERAA